MDDYPESITITLPADMATSVRHAVAEGEYASTHDIVREALADWERKRAGRLKAEASLHESLQRGLDDIDAGRVDDFNLDRVVARARLLPAKHASSG